VAGAPPPVPDRTSQRRETPWHWRRAPYGWASYEATVSGPLGEDGGYVVVGRREPVKLPCPTCGRYALQWRAAVGLPGPFPRTGPRDGSGCTRDHAANAVPTCWEDIAQAYRHAAQRLREDPVPSLWPERLAALRTLQADRAQWLSGQPRSSRQLAMRLWATTPELSVSDTHVLVMGIVSAPEAP
jgi:hypothetical protein